MKFLHALTLFATVGLALAKQFFVGLGIHADYATIGAIGLAITTLLIFRSIFVGIAIALLCVMITFTPELLLDYHLDKDMLLAAALTIILFPWISKFVKDN